jgi:hypothetical protein
VFRDQDELPTSAELTGALQQALEQSRFLVVICSPSAAASRWVNEEIRYYKSLGRNHRIMCLIVDGEPNASDKPDCGLLECFPASLRYSLAADDQAPGERCEPMAADVRDGGKSRQTAQLKILAALMGVGYDELVQRDRRRAVRRRVTLIAGALLVLGAVAWMWRSQEGKRLAQVQEQRLGRLVEEGRQAFVAGDPQRALPWLAAAYREGDRSPALRYLLGRALENISPNVAEIQDPQNPGM